GRRRRQCAAGRCARDVERQGLCEQLLGSHQRSRRVNACRLHIFPCPMIDIKVPPLGDSITEATISRWTKNEGDAVAVGETIVELETDKINVEVPAQKAGVLTKRLRNEGDVVKVDEVLAHVDESGSGTAKGASSDSGTAASGTAGSVTPAPAPVSP